MKRTSVTVIWIFCLLFITMSSAVAFAETKGIENENHNRFVNGLKGKRVVFITFTMSDDLGIGWNALMQRQAKKYGYTVEVRDANWSAAAGARALTAAITDKPDLIVLQNFDLQSYAKLIKRATKAGIKVLQLNMESLTPSDAYVGADWQGIGELAGQAVVERCGEGKGPSNKIQIVMGSPTGACDNFQIYGFLKVLKDHPEIEIVSQQATGYDPTKARAITQTVLQQHPDLCASFGIWDGMDSGAGAAVKEAGKSDQVFVVTSGGGNTVACENLKNGIFSMLIIYDVRYQGVAINQAIANLLLSKEPANTNMVLHYPPYRAYTKDEIIPGTCSSEDEY